MADPQRSRLLSRGTRILMENVPHSRTFSLGFFFPSGSRQDPPGKAGLAHLVEHLVFKGTDAYSASELARLADRVGGDLNAWTDREEMAFTCTVPAEHWRTGLEALVQLTLFPLFPEAEVEREKEVIRNEILATHEDPEDLAYEEFVRLLDPGDWSRPVAGTVESLAGLSRQDAVSWWAQYLCPENLTVVACGTVLDVELCSQFELWLANVPASTTAPVAESLLFKPAPILRRIKSDFQMVQILGGWHFPRPSTLREATVWQIFSMLWGETMSSRLFQGLRERRGLCYSVSSQIFDTESEWGLQFFATAAPENSQALVEALREEIEGLVALPPTPTEWEDARLALRGGMILGAEKAESRVQRLWRYRQSFGDERDFESALLLLDTPVSDREKDGILACLSQTPPSLLVWGNSPFRSDATLQKLWRSR